MKPELLNEQSYAAAIEQLLHLENLNCGGSAIAAQLLLGMYNRHHWLVDIVSVCCSLDDKYFRAAMIAINNRRFTGLEPHSVIDDGQQRFSDLWNRWEHLSNENRFSKQES